MMLLEDIYRYWQSIKFLEPKCHQARHRFLTFLLPGSERRLKMLISGAALLHYTISALDFIYEIADVDVASANTQV